MELKDIKSTVVKTFANNNISAKVESKEKNSLYFLIVDLPESGVENYERKYAKAFSEIRQKLDSVWNRSEDHFSDSDKMLFLWINKV